MREGKEKDGKGRLFQRMLFMPKVTHRTGGILRTKKQSVHYRILRSYKDTLHGPSGEIRTPGILNPNQAPYQLGHTRMPVGHYTPSVGKLQPENVWF